MTDDEKGFVSDHRKILAAYEAFQAGRWGQAIEEIFEFIKEKRKIDEAEQLEWAMSFIRRRCAFFRDRLVEEARARWAAGESESRGAMHHWMIDRASSLLCHRPDVDLYLAVSENAEQAIEEGIDVVSSMGVAWEIMAAYALTQDALDELTSDFVMFPGDMEPPKEPSKYCSACEKWVVNGYWIIDDDICSPCAEERM